MSDSIKHECGIAFIRLLKPIEYYHKKYGTAFYGLNKMYLLMEKQRNRGQDGAGLGVIKLDMPPGQQFMYRDRNASAKPIAKIFGDIFKSVKSKQKDAGEMGNDPQWLKQNANHIGELLIGHLRYGTHGKNNSSSCHPFFRKSNWMTKCLMVAGNFNLTNVGELFDFLVDIGQQPRQYRDSEVVLEKMGHFLDEENEKIFQHFKAEGLERKEITEKIATNLDVQSLLQNATRDFDGGYTIAGIMGHGDGFVVRDPNAIRPAFYYANDEVVVAASERPAIQTVFDLHIDDIKELPAGNALIVKKNGDVSIKEILGTQERKSCSFERIYFSRGNDKDIYNERKELGSLLTPQILDAVDHDIDNTVFSFIPNTAESAFYGMLKGIEGWHNEEKTKEIIRLNGGLTDEDIKRILAKRPRVEKIAHKDVKLRTFISADKGRDDLVSHVYDVSYGQVRNGVDTLVVIDDSIVRGTTLKQSILNILDRLKPKKIVIASSAPQIRFPDCYGIDMSMMRDFVAFRAAVSLLEEKNLDHILEEVYQKCLHQVTLPKEEAVNVVKEIYEPLGYEEVSNRIAKIVTPENITAKVEVIYQTIDALHKACPNHQGDWYFSGNYPTPGGNKVVCQAFINFMEKSDKRAYA